MEICSIMECFFCFIFFSGFFGVVVGIWVLFGVVVVFWYLGVMFFEGIIFYDCIFDYFIGFDFISFFFFDVVLVLILVLAIGIYFMIWKVCWKGLFVWDWFICWFLINLFILLVVGGIFCLVFIKYGEVDFIVLVILIFYGLVFFNVSKYIFNDICYLGLMEVGLGFIFVFFIGYGLEFWAIGFGILYIFYGIVMYFKYEWEV